MLGLNPTDQEVVDMPNYIAKDGLIYFPEFCHLVLGRIREEPEDEEQFRQNMFKVGQY
jgi:Ca2+-binding EF-hand superfamily protein